MNQASNGLITDEHNVTRCFWPSNLPEYLEYHDNEWGNPVGNDNRLFEKICLEGFQAGLSWLTILRKRENFREAFDGFNISRVAAMGDPDIEKLVQNAGIIRHRGKITSTINNANRALEMIESEGSLAAYFWRFEPKPSHRPRKVTYDWLIKNPTSETSTAISKDLKKRGWSFVGPTTVYAFMQAMGMVNDHVEGCFCREKIEKARENFTRPV